jgi:flagellar hook-associated protein 2
MADSLSLSGLTSGLDTSAIIDQLMAIERRPVQLMQQTQAKASSVLDKLRNLNTKMLALQTSAKTLMSATFAAGTTGTPTASSSNTGAFGVTNTAAAAFGTYSVNITALATAQVTGGGTFNTPTGAGTIRLTDATSGTSKDVAVASGASIYTIRDAINASGAGVTAAVSSGALVLTGATGSAFTVADGPSTTGLAASLGIDSATQTTQNAQLASATINGTSYSSTTNTFSGQLTGVTIYATAVGSGTVTVASSTGTTSATTTTSQIKDLVAKYNDIVTQIKTDSSFDSKSKTSGALLGDSFVSGLQVQLNRMFTETVDPSSPYPNASSIGISVQRDGTLAVDDTKLAAALTADPAAVAKLFNNEDNVTGTDSYGRTIKQNSFGNVSSGTVGDGLATRLFAFVDQMVTSYSLYNPTDSSGQRYAGSLLNRMNSQQSVIGDFDDRIAHYNDRLELREQALKNQFAAMEKAIGLLKNQGNYLSGQLSNMGG